MATVNDYLGSALEWHEAHCQRIVSALYRTDESGARTALADCWEALRAGAEVTADDARSLEYTLLEYELSIVNHFYEADVVGPQFATTYSAITALPPAGPQSDIVQAKTLIGLVGMGTRRGFIDCSAAEMDELLARMPDKYLTPNVWYYVVAWAFCNNSLRHLEQAMEHQTVSTTGWLDNYYWLRTNLMYLLVDGRATASDIASTLKGYSHPVQLREFRRLMLERCEAAGLMHAELYALLEQRESELAELTGTVPPQTPKVIRPAKPE